MMPDPGVAIMAVGMVTAVGIGAKQTAASVRAGIARMSATSVYDKRFQPFTMGLVPDEALPPLVPSLEEVVGLTFAADAGCSGWEPRRCKKC